MDLKTIRQQAKERLKGYCRLCRECNGVVCAGEVPGMGGVGSGKSFTNNLTSLASVKLNMRTLHDAKDPQTEITLFGQKLAAPILGAPVTGTGMHTGGNLGDVDWADMIVEGTIQAGTITATGDGPLPIHYESGLDAIRRFGPGIPIIKPREQEEVIKYIRRAEEAGAIAVGMDIDGAGLIPMKLKGQPVSPKNLKELRELISSTTLPFVVKGIMTVDEAEIAIEAGAAAIVVSNHGGRALDHTPGTAEVLPEIAGKVKGKITIIVDGGIRTGIDVLKMLALGADAVFVGRPLVQAGAGGGSEGIALALKTFMSDLKVGMILTGCNSIADISRRIIS